MALSHGSIYVTRLYLGLPVCDLVPTSVLAKGEREVRLSLFNGHTSDSAVNPVDQWETPAFVLGAAPQLSLGKKIRLTFYALILNLAFEPFQGWNFSLAWLNTSDSVSMTSLRGSYRW